MSLCVFEFEFILGTSVLFVCLCVLRETESRVLISSKPV